MDAVSEISAYLASLDLDACLHARQVLKASPHETTEEVYLVGQNGSEIGRFIRKRIKTDSNFGSSYQQIHEVQQRGRRFRHLPRIYSCHKLGDETTVLMEYVEGTTLGELVALEGASAALAQKIFPTLCDAVSELHENWNPPLIHRDLKPSNIIVGAENLTIIDFGIARTFNANASRDTTRFGTQGYAPPEQFGYKQTDIRSDVYALGMVLAYCLTGEDPTPSTHEIALTEISTFQPFAAIIARATEFDPSARYHNVRELKRAFIALAGAETLGNYGGASVCPGNSGTGNPSFVTPGFGAPPGTPSPTSTVLLAPASPWHKLREFFSWIPLGVGIAWNTLLWLVWLLFAVVAIYVSFSPEGEDLVTYSLTARLLMYAGLFVLATGGIAFALTDKRILRARFPDSPINRSSKVVLISGVLVVVGFVAFVVGALI